MDGLLSKGVIYLKKLFVLLGCILFLTGCDVNYNLVINEDSFDETITMSFLKSQTSYDDLSVYLESKTPVTVNLNENRFYDVDMSDDSNYYNLIYKFKQDSDSISKAYFISNCYPNAQIINSDDVIQLSSGQEFMCFNGDDGLKADSIKINITTDLKVLSNNADSVSGNVYTWNIDGTNYNNKPINMRIQKPVNIVKKVSENTDSYLLLFIVIAILVLSLIVYLLIKFRAKKNNTI